MRIQEYKYNPQTFEFDAYRLLKEKTVADENLRSEEQKIKKDLNNYSLSYFQAYLEYMRTDNEHMGSFLGYLKNEYEMLITEKKNHIKDIDFTKRLEKHINQAEEAFNAYYKIYERLKRNEKTLEEEIKSFKENNIDDSMLNLYMLQLKLMKIDNIHFTVHNAAEEYRSKFGFYFVEECLALRNNGKEYETYQSRMQKIVNGENEPNM